MSRDVFTDLTAGKATVRTFLPRLLTAASRIQNCAYRKITTYQTPQSNLPNVFKRHIGNYEYAYLLYRVWAFMTLHNVLWRHKGVPLPGHKSNHLFVNGVTPRQPGRKICLPKSYFYIVYPKIYLWCVLFLVWHFCSVFNWLFWSVNCLYLQDASLAQGWSHNFLSNNEVTGWY